MNSTNEQIKGTNRLADQVTKTALKAMGFAFGNLKANQKYLKTVDGWMDFGVGIRTEDGAVSQSIHFKNGKAKVKNGVADVTVQLIPKDVETLKLLTSLPPSEIMNLLLKNKMQTIGNMSHLQYFNMLISVLMRKKQIKEMQAQKEERAGKANKKSNVEEKKSSPREKEYVKADSVDPGVKFIGEDQNLSRFSINDFPRLAEFLDIHFSKKPEICTERPAILTNWFRENGFETKSDGTSWEPILRQGHAIKHLLANKKPIIRANDLLAGTTTTKEIGVALYPDGTASLLWGELLTVHERALNPYYISESDIELLNSDIMPFWAKRNFREWVRDEYDSPECQRLDERWAVDFLWKSTALSHTIIDYPKLLSLGANGIISEINEELKSNACSDELKINTLKAMILCYEGLIEYAKNLSDEAKRLAGSEKDTKRKSELERLSEICAHVPANPARTLDEAINAMWIIWVAVHMENTNAGFSLGRMDYWLQPYFVSDMKKIKNEDEREAYIRHAIDIVGCFYMRCTDHLPSIPDIGNYLFGGSSSDQAITLGGVTPDGKDAVCDMTYIFLKVTEILGIRDPNINARFYDGVNSDAFLKRLCEVNVNTAGTPSIHNDAQVIRSLDEFKYPKKHVNDWSATGCVEPTISGKHLGHTNCMMFNMVAALEMALYNGYHPLMRWQLGEKTGTPDSFKTFDMFFDAFTNQLKKIGTLACEYNNLLGEAHSVLRPTPFISAAIEGCIESGRDVTIGGAMYNSSGAACIGLADITDSLMAIKVLVYDKKLFTMDELCKAVSENFVGHDKILAQIKSSTPRFGSGSEEALAMANRVTAFIHDFFASQKNFRGERYTAGFWSMSNHVAFGTLTGALPSGRLAYKPFTPGLTPAANASKSLLDNIRDVARLEPTNMTNNIAFNVKVVPSASDSHTETTDNLYTYAKTYCDLGGMQMQFNVVSSETMKAAMDNPDEYKDLVVRISGYNAYFVTLNRDMQIELIERAEYRL